MVTRTAEEKEKEEHRDEQKEEESVAELGEINKDIKKIFR